MNKRFFLPKPALASLARLVGFVFLASGLSNPVSAAWPNLPSTPLALQNTSDPNLLLTLDDSGSMSWAYAPDSIAGNTVNTRFLSPKFNSMAYSAFDRYDAPFSPLLDGTRLTTTFGNAWHNGQHVARGSVKLSTSYRPVSVMDPAVTAAPTYAAGPGSAWNVAQPAFIYSFYNDLGSTGLLPAPGTDKATFVRLTAAPAGCAGLADTANDNCYIKVVIAGNTLHEQNFANWYSFYKTRNLSVASAANIAFYDLNPKYRVTWQALNTCKNFGNLACAGWSGAVTPGKLRPLEDVVHKTNFYNYLSRLPAANITPLRAAVLNAGTFIKGTGIESPRANQLGISESGPNGAPISTCRANYHVIMTDGIWNGGGTFTVGNADNSGIGALPDGTPYAAIAPFKDANANSIADIAFQQWATDAQPGAGGLANDLIPYYRVKAFPANPVADYWNPINDPATWQHINTFTIGLGLNKYLTGTIDATVGYLPLWGGSTFAGDYGLMSAGTQNWPVTKDDSLGNVADLWHAAINGRGDFFGADSPNDIRDAFRSILARISSSASSAGQSAVSSRRVGTGSLSFNASFKTPEWYGTITARNVYSDGTEGAVQWTSDTTLVSDSPSRSLFTWDPVNNGGRAFVWSSFTAAEKLSYFGTTFVPTGDSDLLDYLRGNRTKETTKFRPRTRLLGDIIGSELVGSSKIDKGFFSLSAADGGLSYAAFVNGKKSAIFVGANDGILHGFDKAGTELFGYFPGAVLPKIKELAKPPLVHAPLVDGPLSLGDAYLGGSWKTLLIGGLGAGGKSVFGLDVTNVTQTSGSGTFSASNVLFEINDPDMGYSFAKPFIGRTKKGDWIAVWGNGYGSTSATAVLFVYNLTTKALSKIPTNVGSTTVGSENGLSSPVGLEYLSGNIVAIYAGDYRGNVWRFDLNTTSGAFALPTGGTPFFKATNASLVPQPITAAIEVARHPAGGAIVLIGTGKFFESEDRSNRNVQSFYAVRDIGQTGTVTRANLRAQTITEGSTLESAKRVVSATPVDYTAYSGWYLDFATTYGGSASGERIVSQPVQIGDAIAVSTYAPGLNACVGAGAGYAMFLNIFNGGFVSPFLDSNGDGVVNSADKNAAGQFYSGVKMAGDGGLSSPSPTFVGIQPPGSSIPAAAGQSCGVENYVPCDGVTAQPSGAIPPKGCLAGLIVKDGLCKKPACKPGNVRIASGPGTTTCGSSEDFKYPRWMELQWK